MKLIKSTRTCVLALCLTAMPATAQDVVVPEGMEEFHAGIELLDLNKKFQQYKQSSEVSIKFVGVVESCEGPAVRKVDGKVTFENVAVPIQGTFAQFVDQQGTYTVCVDQLTLREFAEVDAAYFADLLQEMEKLRQDIEGRMAITGGRIDDNERAYLNDIQETVVAIGANRNKGVEAYAQADAALSRQ